MKTYEPATLVELGAAQELILGETSPEPDNAIGFGEDFPRFESIEE